MRGARWRPGAMRGAALLAGCVVLASCGSGASGPAASRATGQPRQTGQAQPADQGPLPGSKAEALHLAESLVAHVVLPSGSARLSGPVPPVFRQWGPPGVSIPEMAAASGLWISSQSMNRVSVLASAHPPAGTRFLGNSPMGAGGQPPTEVDYLLTAAPPGIADGGVRVLVAPGRQGGSQVLAVAIVRWYPPRSAAEHVPPGMRQVTISVTIASGRPRAGPKVVTSPEVIGRLASLLNAMHAAPSYADRSCLAPFASYRLAFAVAPGAPPALIATTGDCSSVAMQVHGTAQPPLDDEPGLLARAAARLLGLWPPFFPAVAPPAAPSPGTAPATGTVTGVAARCSGTGDAPITVYAARQGRIVASQKVLPVKGGGRYHLRLPAGTYVISAPGSGLPARPVTLHARKTVTVNFPDRCK